MPAIPSISPSLRNWPDPLLAQPLDVHRPAAHEVLDGLEQLAGAAGAVGADRPDAALGLDRRRAARRALRRRLRARGARFLRFCAFAVGDTTRGITSPARVTITSSPSRTSLRAMSSSLCSVASFTVTPGDLHRLELGEGHHVAGAPHVPHHPLERRGGGHRRELPGDRPARLAAHHAEPALQVQVVDLHHHAVDLEVERLAPLLPRPAGRDHLVERVVALDVGVDLEAVLAQPLERLEVALELDPLERADRVGPHRQRPRRGDARVELADRARGGVARVGVGGLAGRGALLVELGERAARQVGLAAHLEQRRRALHPQRDRLDRAQVLGHVLADLAVAAGGAARRARRPRRRSEIARPSTFGSVTKRISASSTPSLFEQALGALQPGAQLLLVARVGQREHRLQVARRLEALLSGLAPTRWVGESGVTQVGVLRLEVAQLVQQRVVLGVGDLRVVEDVVAVVVVLELRAQLVRALGGLGQTSRAAGASSRSRSKPDSSSTPAWSVRSKCSGVTAISPSAIAAKSVPSSWW